MHTQSLLQGEVKGLVMAATIMFILLGSFASEVLSSWEPFLVLGMMLLLGLPHGATDHGLFLALDRSSKRLRKSSFYLAYLLVIGAYGLVWWITPTLAFVIFMLLSVYHFGQSNWINTDHGHANLARFHYLIWGAGILLTPILLHVGEAIAIVQAMTGVKEIVAPSHTSILYFIGFMAILNVGLVGLLRWQGKITTKTMLTELVAYALLITMFFTNSLLLGFSVYFVCWHSLASAKDQLQFFKLRLSPALRRQLYGEIGMTVLGAMVFCLIIWFGPGPEAALQPHIIGGVFIFISLLTLPHMLLVEQLYTYWSPTGAASPLAPKQKQSIITRTPDAATETASQGSTIIHKTVS